jgi:negative regulator of flagellin synthesis FlgM
MTIERLGGIDPLKNVQNTHKPASKASVSTEPDSIIVSAEAKEMAEAYYLSEVSSSTPDVRADRIAQVKEKIKDPGYINATVIDSVANRILDSYGL